MTSLRAAGFQVERQDRESGLGEVFYGFGQGLIEWVVTSPGGEQTILQIAHFDRNHAPVSMDVGPVLNPLDAIASKVRAFVTRAEERDAIDVAAALGRYNVDQLIALACQLEPGTGIDVQAGRLLYVCDFLPAAGTHVVHITFEATRSGGTLGDVAEGADTRPIRGAQRGGR